jgi:hypothetical protein
MRRRLSRSCLTLCAALSSAACNKSPKPSDAGSPSARPVPSVLAPAAGLSALPEASADPWEGHPPHPPPPPPPGASATALKAAFRERITTLRVSAHVGSVIIRKQGASWVSAGEAGCTVPPRRIDAALDQLARLKAVKTEEQPADGRAFELQVMAQMGEDIALQLDVANRNASGDLVQLFDGSRYRIRGLDRSFWSPRPAHWCGEL